MCFGRLFFILLTERSSGKKNQGKNCQRIEMRDMSYQREHSGVLHHCKHAQICNERHRNAHQMHGLHRQTISYRLYSLRFKKYMINRTNISKSISGAARMSNVLRAQCSCSFAVFSSSSLLYFLLFLALCSHAIKIQNNERAKEKPSISKKKTRSKKKKNRTELISKYVEKNNDQFKYIDARNRFPNEWYMKYNACYRMQLIRYI